MRVVTAGAGTIELGELEATPTVSIINYSRRVTDDFGVTTVVERGFARRMAVRLAMPLVNVDALQRNLATLRATSALWVANDQYASLSVQGIYKDFALDLAVPPLSYCTLTVEGVAETVVPADPGGDPAPDGMSSSLQMIQPVTIAGSMLASTNVAQADAPEWSLSAPYAMGARVMKAATHRVYESVISGNNANDPATSTGKWLDVGPTNRWAMFDQALGTATTASGSIVVTLDAGVVTALALLDVAGATVRVQATGYDSTQAVVAGAIPFLDLPVNSGAVTVTITGPGTVSVGTLVVGRLVNLGSTEASPTAGITDYSRQEVDDFGEVTVVQRAWAKRMTANALIRTDALDAVFNRLATVRATPSLWIGKAGLDSLTVYGFFKDFSIEVGSIVSKLSLSIEGLSTASKAGPVVNWPDIGDPDGTKPADGATVGGTVGVDIKNPNGTLYVPPVIDFGPLQAEMDLEVGQVRQELVQAKADLQADDAAIRVTIANIQGGGGSDGWYAAVSDEAAARANADSSISNRLSTVEANYVTPGAAGTIAAAKVSDEATARSNADSALSGRISTVEASYTTAGAAATIAQAKVDSEAAVRTNADGALGLRIDSVSASLASNTNLCPDVPEWSLLGGTSQHYNSPYWGPIVYNNNPQAAGYAIYSQSPAIDAAQSTYTLSCDLLGFGSNGAFVSADILAYDGGNNLIGQSPQTNTNVGSDFANGPSRFKVTYTTPANTVRVIIRFLTFQNNVGDMVNTGIRRPKLELGSVATLYSLEGQSSANAASIKSEAAARVAADSAIATRTTTLEATTGNNVARLTNVESVASDAYGRSRAFIQQTAVAGNGRAQLTLYADSNGGGGVDIVGDVGIRGNLIVDGTVSWSEMNIGDLGNSGSASWSGSVSASGGASQTIPVSVGLGTIHPSGYFTADIGLAISTNAGTTTSTTYLGKPYQIHYANNGGLNLRITDNQGHVHNFLPSNISGSFNGRYTILVPVAASSDFAGNFSATLASGSSDTGIVDQGDYYERTISATYTVTAFNIVLRWAAI